MWAAAAAAYAAGCGETSAVTICVQPCWGSGKHCCWGSVSLPFPGLCMSQGQVIHLRAGSLWCCVQSSSHLMRLFSLLGCSKGIKVMKALSWSLCSEGAFTTVNQIQKQSGGDFLQPSVLVEMSYTQLIGPLHWLLCFWERSWSSMSGA